MTNVDNTISGDFNFLSFYGLVNDSAGVIDANNVVSGSTTRAEISAGAITNAGLIESTGPDPLFLFASSIDNTGGVISAGNGSVVTLFLGPRNSPGTLVGGTLQTVGTGVISADNLILDGTAAAVNIQGIVNILQLDESELSTPSLGLNGTINNSGTISLAGTPFVTILTIGQANVTLAGGGAVVLTDSGHNNIVTGASSGATLTNFNNTISGAGHLGNGSMGLINEAAGVINGDGSRGLVLDTGANTVVNAGLIEATGAGGLTIRSTAVDGSGGGVILAGSGSHVGLQGDDLIGGTLKSAGSGVFLTFAGANALDGRASAVNNEAVVIVAAGTGLTLQGAIDNTRKLQLQSAGGAAALTVGASGATLSGGGQVQMDNSAKNLVTGATSAATLTNIDNSINGAGQIGAGQLTLINEAKGVIVGSASAALVIDTGASAITNAGLIVAKGAGGVTIASAVANSGVLEAAGGVMTVNGAVSGSGEAVIAAGTLDFTSSFNQRVVFTGTSGVLELGQSQSYTGAVFGFSKTGGTSLDLRDIGFVSSTEASFKGSALGGVLTVTDGSHTAHIVLKGDYRASTFIASSDGHGGTIIVDPATPSATAAHRFIAAAAGFGAQPGAPLDLAHEAWRPRLSTLMAPRVQIA